MAFDRRRFIKTAGASAIAMSTLAGCLGDDDDDGDDELSLAIISGPGGFGDQAYNDYALDGLENAADEFGGSVDTVTGEQGEYESIQRDVADVGHDLIVCVSNYQADALSTNAEEYPDQRWMLINQGLYDDDGNHYENVAGYVWANHEMSYQAGVAAGTMTSRDFTVGDVSTDPDGLTVGFVGGVDSALINAFEEAYVAGVNWVNSDIEVLTGYAGSFEEPSAGEEVADSQINEGADIVYHAAAGTGPGIFESAQAADRFAIGVDADQSVTLDQFSDVIMGSAVKYMDVGTYEVAEAVYNDEWDDVQGEHVLGLAVDAVEFVKGQDIGPELPDVVDENLEESKQAIIDGEIDVPCEATGC